MKMLARSKIGVEEYLDLVFEDRPEPDYVDGEVVEEPCQHRFIAKFRAF